MLLNATPFPFVEEPTERFDDRYCHVALTRDPSGYLDALEADLIAVADGRLAVVLPPKLLFDDPAQRSPATPPGDFRVMPCVVRGPGRITKTVKVVGTNFQRSRVGERITVGRALLLDPIENYVSADFAAFALSSARTGACATLAMRRFARGSTLSVYGAGPVGWYSAFFAAADGRVDAVRFIDPRSARAARAAASLAGLFPALEFAAVASSSDEDRAIAVIATDSRSVVLTPAQTQSGLVVSLGADSDRQCELDPAWAGRGRIVVDHPDSALIGDLRHWLAQGLLDRAAIGTLLDPGVDDGSPTIFISTGSALLDNLTIHYLMSGRRDSDQTQCETKSSNFPPGPAGIESQ